MAKTFTQKAFHTDFEAWLS